MIRDLNRSFDWTASQRQCLNNLDEAIAFEEEEEKSSRLANQRVRAAGVLVEKRRLTFIRSIPDGAGLQIAEACPWLGVSWHSSNTHGDRWVVDVGVHIHDVAKELPEIARILGETVTITLNEIPVTASAGDDPESLVRQWISARENGA